MFVLISCFLILRRGQSERPALLLIMFNAAVDVFTIVCDSVVMTDVVNPNIGDMSEGSENLPSEKQLIRNCRVEVGTYAYL